MATRQCTRRAASCRATLRAGDLMDNSTESLRRLISAAREIAAGKPFEPERLHRWADMADRELSALRADAIRRRTPQFGRRAAATKR